MKIFNKKIITILIIFLTIVGFTVNSFAWSISDFNPSGTTVTGTEGIKKVGNNTVFVITTIGIVASVVILIIIGLKYMLGSVEEKATYKKSLMPYVIGAGLLFAASTIATIIFNWAKTL